MFSNHNSDLAQHLDQSPQTGQDALHFSAVQEGTRRIDRDEIEEVSLQFTDAEVAMLKKLTASLALSVKVVVECAINYAYFYAKERKLSVDQLPEYPQTLGSQILKLSLAAETEHKLDELGMSHKLSECAVTGVWLLHHQLIEKARAGA